MLQLQKPLVLASQSPRRQEILEQAGFEFTVKVAEGQEETYPDHFQPEQVPVYLAERKALYFKDSIGDELILAADTVVTFDGELLGKPGSREEAEGYLHNLSGRNHQVISGVCLLGKDVYKAFYDTTTVHFRKLTHQEINHYIDHYQPYDKAGAYGIQEWIGMIGIDKIEGSYFNVMGLPVHRVYTHLSKWLASTS